MPNMVNESNFERQQASGFENTPDGDDSFGAQGGGGVLGLRNMIMADAFDMDADEALCMLLVAIKRSFRCRAYCRW